MKRSKEKADVRPQNNAQQRFTGMSPILADAIKTGSLKRYMPVVQIASQRHHVKPTRTVCNFQLWNPPRFGIEDSSGWRTFDFCGVNNVPQNANKRMLPLVSGVHVINGFRSMAIHLGFDNDDRPEKPSTTIQCNIMAIHQTAYMQSISSVVRYTMQIAVTLHDR